MESASEVETRRLKCVLQRGEAGLEQIDTMVRVLADAGDEPRFHDRRIADNREKPASGLELRNEGRRQSRRRARQHDDIIWRMVLPALRGVADRKSVV